MKKGKNALAVLVCAVLCFAAFTACADAGPGKSTLLRSAAAAQEFSYSESKTENFAEIAAGADSFAASFTAAAFQNNPAAENFAVSPVSIYMALALAAECSGGETRQELLAALRLPYETLRTDFQYLYRSLSQKFETGEVTVGNSVWVNENTQVNADCLDALSEQYYCYSYSADFQNDNAEANRAVRRFVKEQTNGLIDKDFALAPETYFTLINTLYLKDTWNMFGNDLSFTESEQPFSEASGTTRMQKFLQSYYITGRPYEGESFTSFYAATEHGYRIKFILPRDGYSLEDVFTSENLSLVNDITDYNGFDDENKIHYYTRCLFPEFHAVYDRDIKELLQSNFGINGLFDPKTCDLSALLSPSGMTDGNAYCGEVRHVTDLTVNRKGIEGAAVTVEPGAGDPGPDEYTEVYLDFAVNKPFGFIIADSYGTTLFSGTVYTI